MSKNPRFREAFDKQHATRAKALLKMSLQHIYHIYWTMLGQLSWKTSLWLTCKILSVLVKTLAADEKYPVLKRDNLMIPIQSPLSRKQKSFCHFFADFPNLYEILNSLSKKMTLIDFVFPKLRTAKKLSYKCLKSPV